jgi:Asp-tRNA(Asn)/Glu-tRNA(Gln) amidotransferase A subunit family amidase
MPELFSDLEHLFEDREPAIQAFVPEAGRFERLRREATALAAAYPNPADRPPLFGVLVGIKDIFHVAGMETRAGSRLPPDVLQGAEGQAVRALKRAGALIMGKTVSTEFAYFGPGPTRNPRSPAGAVHTPGGSSSGSAAAVAAGLCPLALGTQTIGSIIRPAAFCGVVGFKPSFGRIATDGVIPLAPSLDHVGAFAGDVVTIQAAAAVLCADWQPAELEGLRGLSALRLGLPAGPYLAQAGEDAQRHLRAMTDRLATSGVTVLSVDVMADFDAIRARHNLIVAAEAAQVHAAWYDRFRDRYHPKTVELIERGRAVGPDALAEARAGREVLRAQLLGAMEAHGLDAWVAPSAPGPAPAGLESTGDPVMNLPWTHSGLPAVSLPAGQAENGLPLGLQLIGRWQADEALLAWAALIAAVLPAI